jgi:hypothetical protein
LCDERRTRNRQNSPVPDDAADIGVVEVKPAKKARRPSAKAAAKIIEQRIGHTFADPSCWRRRSRMCPLLSPRAAAPTAISGSNFSAIMCSV